MSTPAPAEEAVDLFNQLARLAPADVQTIQQIHWRLRRLRSKSPSDMATALAYSQALIMLGEAQEALAVCDQIWWMRQVLDYEMKYALTLHLEGLGVHARAFELAISLLKEQQDKPDYNLAAIALYAGWGLGDTGSVRWALGKCSPVRRETWDQFLARIDGCGLSPFLADHQRIVHDTVFGRHTLTTLLLSRDESGDVELSHYLYSAEDRDARIALEEQIHDRLDEFYGSRGKASASYWEIMTPILLPVTAAGRGADEEAGHRQDAPAN